MKNKTNVLQQAELLLQPLALAHVPQESCVEAVVDQWLHAIATDSQLYCNPKLEDPQTLKEDVLSVLRDGRLYTTRKTFFKHVFGGLRLKPSFNAKFRFIDLFAGIGGVRLAFSKMEVFVFFLLSLISTLSKPTRIIMVKYRLVILQKFLLRKYQIMTFSWLGSHANHFHMQVSNWV